MFLLRKYIHGTLLNFKHYWIYYIFMLCGFWKSHGFINEYIYYTTVVSIKVSALTCIVSIKIWILLLQTIVLRIIIHFYWTILDFITYIYYIFRTYHIVLSNVKITQKHHIFLCIKVNTSFISYFLQKIILRFLLFSRLQKYEPKYATEYNKYSVCKHTHTHRPKILPIC